MQPASLTALPVKLPHTSVALPSSLRLTRSSSKAVTMLPKAVEPSDYIDVLASNKEEEPDPGNANSTLGGLKLPPELLGTSDMPPALMTVLHGAGTTSVQGSSRCNNVEARKKALTFIEQQIAVEQASRLAAAKVS